MISSIGQQRITVEIRSWCEITYRVSSAKSPLFTIALFVSDNSSDGHFTAFIRCQKRIMNHFNTKRTGLHNSFDVYDVISTRLSSHLKPQLEPFVMKNQ